MQNGQDSCDAHVPRSGAGGITQSVRPKPDPFRMGAPAVARIAPSAAHIPGLVVQPDEVVRVAYWRARQLIDIGWRIHALGQPVSRYGFIAEIPCGVRETTFVVCPRTGMRNDGAAADLANSLRRLSVDQRNHLRRLLDALHGSGAVAGADLRT